ncbi:MAG: copper chaperone PCu(A)C [Caldilineaceae bacterium]|nr:copper chaperone PCu(A)C [Caldilineaceae bacterium]
MKNRIWLAGWLALLLLMSAACGSQAQPTATPQPTPVPGQVTLLDLAAPETSTAMANGAVYFVLQNGTAQSVHLQSATATVATALSFHETTENQGVLRMVAQPDGFIVPAGESLVLAPGGRHLMLEKLHAPLVAGEQFTLTLTFADAPAMTVTVPVTSRGGDESMDHSQMNHGK